MESKEIKDLLQRYFDAETSMEEEKELMEYFSSGNVDDKFSEYTSLFRGISELSDTSDESGIEEDVMNYVLEQETRENTKNRWLWKAVTGIAASVLLFISGYMIYENQRSSYKDTFDDPSRAYAYAMQTLKYVSSEYNKGLVQLSNFEKIENAARPLEKGIKPLNDFLQGIEIMKKENTDLTIKNE